MKDEQRKVEQAREAAIIKICRGGVIDWASHNFRFDLAREALDAFAAVVRKDEQNDDKVCTDGYCSTCGAIALFGADYCENHIPPQPSSPPAPARSPENYLDALWAIETLVKADAPQIYEKVRAIILQVGQLKST